MFRKRETGVNDDNDGRGQGRGEGRGPATIARGSKGAAAPAGRARFPRTKGCRRGSLRAKTMTGERARRRNGATARRRTAWRAPVGVAAGRRAFLTVQGWSCIKSAMGYAANSVWAEELGENRRGGLPGRIRKVLLFVIVEGKKLWVFWQCTSN